MAIGLSIGVAPQWVAGSTGAGHDGTAHDATDIAVPAPAVEVADDAPSAPADPAPVRTLTAPAPAAAPDAPVVTVAPVPAVATTAAPAPVTTVAPVPTPPVPAVATTAAAAPETVELPSTTTVHVDVAPADGATRSVSLLAGDGARVGGPVTVDRSRISFPGLPDGTYDLLVEQVADGGGAFVTRTIIDATGRELTVTCDAETLACTTD